MNGPRRSVNGAVGLMVLASVACGQVSVRQSASVDLAALAAGEIRMSIEPVVFGRTALGVSLGRWWGGGGTLLAVPTGSAFGTPGGDALHPDREYLVDLYARVYPPAFSGSNGLHVSGYIGGFLGLDERERDQTSACPVGYACPLVQGSNGSAICACPLVASPGTVCPCPVPPAPQITQDRVFAVEPGVEVGIRAIPTDYLVLELGGWARMITARDPTARFEEGQIDPRLTLSIGVRW